MASEKREHPKSVYLRVGEALIQDVDNGIARITPESLQTIGVNLGDIVEITGRKRTVAKVVPTPSEFYGKNMILMDSITRENAQVGLDEKVQVQKVSHSLAEAVVLTPVDIDVTFHTEQDVKHILHVLKGLPVIADDKVKVSITGSRAQYYAVSGTIPKGAIIITANTAIKIKEPDFVERKEFRVSYEDIGGLNREIQRIREMVELPIRFPKIFRKLGIEAPKGILLYGTPGTGKTLIARAIATETNAYFVHINGPEIMHKFYGESEARLRDIFEEARRHAPSIIFLDEIDAIAPKRAEVLGDVEKRVVAQLLALMDGLVHRGEVIVIGATNMLDLVDPALRRPGRFDREIVIPVPNYKDRLEILQIHTRRMPLAEDVNLDRLAHITYGFVGADLANLCKEAGMITLRRILADAEFEYDRITAEIDSELYVNMKDFLEALKEVEPSATREFFVERPNVKLSEVGGLEEIKRTMRTVIEFSLKQPELFEQMKIQPHKGILLSGPPGTGKTLLVKAIASESEVNFISVDGPSLFSKWLGQSEKALREIFKKAKQASPALLFFDEIDALVPKRGVTSQDMDTSGRIVSQFCACLDGLEELKGVLVIAATNRIDRIDPALLRPGRFDFILEFPVPDQQQKLEIFKVHTQGKPLADDVDLHTLVNSTDSFVGSDIESTCKKAAMFAVMGVLEAGKDKGNYAGFKITAQHFQEAIKEVAREKQKVRSGKDGG
jgi:transitional endoplasmic reticulum ATPase